MAAKKRKRPTAQEVRDKERLKNVAENRADFMKRWFAIAISVGFATAVSNMGWLKPDAQLDFSLAIDWPQVEQVARLTVAAIATILSWEGYLLSISTKPLVDESRFYTDILLVFVYLLLLLTSKFPYFWLWIHAGTFLLYCFWDYRSIKVHRSAYINRPPASSRFSPSVEQVYLGSLADDPRIYRGPAITLMWPIYFFALAISYQLLQFEERSSPRFTIAYAFFVFYGLIAYRQDKRKRLPFWARWGKILVSVLVVLGVDLVLRLIG